MKESELHIQLEKLNKKLADNEKVMSHFLSNVRNEINNPLAAILGLSKNLLQQVSSNDTMKKHLELIYKDAIYLDYQLRNIIQAAEIESGEVKIEAEQTIIAELLEVQIKNFEFRAIAKKQNIEFIDNSSKKGIITDAAKLSVITANLLANALEFSPVQSSVIVTVNELSENSISIHVKDFGEGIDEKNSENIFDRFKQLNTGTSKLHGGHGLGLSIVKALTEILNGELSVNSERGEGSEFICTFSPLERNPNDFPSDDFDDFIIANSPML